MNFGFVLGHRTANKISAVLNLIRWIDSFRCLSRWWCEEILARGCPRIRNSKYYLLKLLFGKRKTEARVKYVCGCTVKELCTPGDFLNPAPHIHHFLYADWVKKIVTNLRGCDIVSAKQPKLVSHFCWLLYRHLNGNHLYFKKIYILTKCSNRSSNLRIFRPLSLRLIHRSVAWLPSNPDHYQPAIAK